MTAMFRSDTVRTMQSRAWSTAELSEGLAHILTDGRLEVPDDAAQLKEPIILSMLSPNKVGRRSNGISQMSL